MYGQNPYYNQIPQYGNYYAQQQSYTPPTLFGKVVDGIETVRATDVPFNQSGIYPKADGSMIFIKSWGNDGTTHIDEYRRVEQMKDNGITLEDIKDSILELNKKIDSLSPSPTRGVPMTKKKVVTNDES